MSRHSKTSTTATNSPASFRLSFAPCFLYFTLPAFFLRGFFFSLKISHYPYPARQYTDKRTRHLRYYTI